MSSQAITYTYSHLLQELVPSFLYLAFGFVRPPYQTPAFGATESQRLPRIHRRCQQQRRPRLEISLGPISRGPRSILLQTVMPCLDFAAAGRLLFLLCFSSPPPAALALQPNALNALLVLSIDLVTEQGPAISLVRTIAAATRHSLRGCRSRQHAFSPPLPTLLT